MKFRLLLSLFSGIFIFIICGCIQKQSNDQHSLVTSDSVSTQARQLAPVGDDKKPEAQAEPETETPRIIPPEGFKAKNFHYDLNNPDEKYKLDSDLMEISGLSYIGPGKMVAVQDEKGKIFLFDEKEKDITKDKKFEKKGDFEAIEVVGNIAYVLRSDGRLYQVKNYLEEDPIVERFKTGLRSKNDTEGLGYDPVTRSLLIACKSSPNLGDHDDFKGNRAIYAFDLKDMKIVEKPFLLINLDTINNHINDGSLTEISKEIIKTFKGDISFQPSGISVHPISNKIYIIASVGKLLLVTDRSGKLEAIMKLEKDVFKHPEGITFAPNGDLYISNEGDGGKGNILKFSYQP